MSLARRQVIALAALIFVLTACGPANDRPVRGAVPGTTAPTAEGVPPTLAASDALRQRTPTPSPAVAAQPSPKPGVSPVASPSAVAAPPIVRTIVPGANGHVASGAVTLSAVLVGRGSDLASASLSVNGADAGAQIDKRSPRDWTIHASETLPDGTHTARVLVKDASGAAGGFTWKFVVGEEPPAEDNG